MNDKKEIVKVLVECQRVNYAEKAISEAISGYHGVTIESVSIIYKEFIRVVLCAQEKKEIFAALSALKKNEKLMKYIKNIHYKNDTSKTSLDINDIEVTICGFSLKMEEIINKKDKSILFLKLVIVVLLISLNAILFMIFTTLKK